MGRMRHDEDAELNPERHEELRILSRDPDPPRWLEQRAVDSFRSRGLLVSWVVASVTACVFRFGAGMLSGAAPLRFHPRLPTGMSCF